MCDSRKNKIRIFAETWTNTLFCWGPTTRTRTRETCFGMSTSLRSHVCIILRESTSIPGCGVPCPLPPAAAAFPTYSLVSELDRAQEALHHTFCAVRIIVPSLQCGAPHGGNGVMCEAKQRRLDDITAAARHGVLDRTKTLGGSTSAISNVIQSEIQNRQIPLSSARSSSHQTSSSPVRSYNKVQTSPRSHQKGTSEVASRQRVNRSRRSHWAIGSVCQICLLVVAREPSPPPPPPSAPPPPPPLRSDSISPRAQARKQIQTET